MFGLSTGNAKHDFELNECISLLHLLCAHWTHSESCDVIISTKKSLVEHCLLIVDNSSTIFKLLCKQGTTAQPNSQVPRHSLTVKYTYVGATG